MSPSHEGVDEKRNWVKRDGTVAVSSSHEGLHRNCNCATLEGL
jgi:hypothetical protein